MTYHAILIASVVLLLAFAIERIGRVTGVPAVIVMVVVGLVARPLFAAMGLTLDGLDVTVPILGTIGLVLIVLEGALDIKLRREQLRLVSGAIAMAAAGFILCAVLFAMAAVQVLDLSYFQALIISIPFAVISSAVAIQSSHFLPAHGRQFVIYESSVSDILGVLVFFALLNSDGSFGGVIRGLLGGGALSLLLATVCSVGLALMLMHIDGHIRFIPLLAGLFALYSIGEILHLSPLIMVLLFGLALNNPKIITRFKPLRGWMDSSYETTLNQFKLLVMELTFAVRGFFFILLGYWTDLSDLASLYAWLSAAFMLSVVYAGRYAMLKSFRHSLTSSLTWIAPRGLITVVLFLGANNAMSLPRFLNGTIVLVVLVSAALVAVGQYHARAAGITSAAESDSESGTP
ncbi:MAG: cation:proton antiporter [Azonexus sp.]